MHMIVMLPGSSITGSQLRIVLPYEDHFLSMTQTLCRISVLVRE